jgi:hypothetical protein
MTMSDSALRAPSINLDEFERRLRAAGSFGGAQEDPLAELSRLLGLDEPAGSEHSPQDHAAAPELGEGDLVAPGDEAAEPFASSTEPSSAHDEGPRGAVIGGAPTPSTGATRPLAPQEFEGRARRPRAAVWVMALLVFVGAAAGAGAWFYRLGVPGLQAKLPPLIMAAEGPTKVQPPSQETVASPNDVTSLLAKDQPAKGAPVNVVSNSEQPVDLAVQSKAQAGADAQSNAPAAEAPTIAAAPLVVVTQPSTAGVTAPSASAATAGANAASAATAAPSAPSAAAPASPQPSVSASVPAEPPAPFPQPKRVKTVSVRPDGSVIASVAPPTDDSGAPPAVAPTVEMPKPSLRPSTSAVDAESTTPKLDLPAKPPAKSTARVPVNKLDTTAAANGQSPEGPMQIAPSLQREAALKKHDAGARPDATNSSPPTVLPQDSATTQPAAKPSPAGQTRMARLTPPDSNADAPTKTAAAAAGGTGDYAVQLAAPGSEAEAQSVSSRLKAKFAAELGGADPVIRKADLEGGRTVYRIRVVGLAKSDAVSLCEKLKANGGACFIARE